MLVPNSVDTEDDLFPDQHGRGTVLGRGTEVSTLNPSSLVSLDVPTSSRRRAAVLCRVTSLKRLKYKRRGNSLRYKLVHRVVIPVTFLLRHIGEGAYTGKGNLLLDTSIFTENPIILLLSSDPGNYVRCFSKKLTVNCTRSYIPTTFREFKKHHFGLIVIIFLVYFHTFFFWTFGRVKTYL